jgi:hypothetical protein
MADGLTNRYKNLSMPAPVPDDGRGEPRDKTVDAAPPGLDVGRLGRG